MAQGRMSDDRKNIKRLVGELAEDLGITKTSKRKKRKEKKNV